MNPSAGPEPDLCPRCGADVEPGRMTCWLCSAPLGVAARAGEGASPAAAIPRTAFVPPDHTYSLQSLLLIITLVAVSLGIAVQVPGLGIPLAVLAAPALIRTMVIRGRRRVKGQPMTAGDKVLAFLGSLAVVAVIATASIGAFVAICFSIGLAAFSANSGILMVAAWVLGIGVGGTIGFFLIRWLWLRAA